MRKSLPEGSQAMHGNAIAKVLEQKPVKIVAKLPEGVKNWAPPGGSMVVSSPGEVYELMRAVPKGKLISLDTLRDTLATRHGTSIACPVSTAIFINVAAQAAEDWTQIGKPDTAAWWRTLKSGGALNDRYPGGIEAHQAKLELEGHTVVQKGKKLLVQDWEKSEFELTSSLPPVRASSSRTADRH
jgi:alkylated DNA nucleotide flippase Atl1